MTLKKFQQPNPERDLKVVNLIKEGKSYRAVAKLFKISHQRVDAIYKRNIIKEQNNDNSKSNSES